MQLTSKQKNSLKAQAHTLKPLVQIGHNGVTQAQIQTIHTHLDTHELIKIRFNDYKSQKQELSQTITEATQSSMVSLIGNTLTIYKRNPDPEKQKISF